MVVIKFCQRSVNANKHLQLLGITCTRLLVSYMDGEFTHMSAGVGIDGAPAIKGI